MPPSVAATLMAYAISLSRMEGRRLLAPFLTSMRLLGYVADVVAHGQ